MSRTCLDGMDRPAVLGDAGKVVAVLSVQRQLVSTERRQGGLSDDTRWPATAEFRAARVGIVWIRTDARVGPVSGQLLLAVVDIARRGRRR